MGIPTITARCELCEWQGRVKAELENKRGKCPHCKEVITLHAIDLEPDPPITPKEEAPVEAPAEDTPAKKKSTIKRKVDLSKRERPRRPMKRKFYRDAMRAGSALFWQNWGKLVLAMLGICLLIIVSGMLEHPQELTRLIKFDITQYAAPWMLDALSLICLFLAFAIYQAIQKGLIQAVNQQSKLNTFPFLDGWRSIPGTIVIACIFAPLSVIGMIAFIIPVFFVVAAYYMADMLHLERRKNMFSAIGAGFGAIKPHWGAAMWMTIIVPIIAQIGFILIGIGALFTFPLALCIYTCAYVILRDIYFDEPDHIAWLISKRR